MNSKAANPKPKRYYDSVALGNLNRPQDIVRGVIHQNKTSTTESASLQSTGPKQYTSNQNEKDPFFADDDNLADYKKYPSCYNRKKVTVVPLSKAGKDSHSQPQVSESTKEKT